MKTLGLILLGFACGLAVFAAWYWGVSRQEQDLSMLSETPRGVLHANTPPLGVEVVAGGGSPSHPLAGLSPSLLSDSPPVDISPVAMPGLLSGQLKGERRIRYDRLTRDQQQAFLLAAESYVERYHRDSQAWWVRAQDMDDETFIKDDTLSRLRLQLGQDLENLLPR